MTDLLLVLASFVSSVLLTWGVRWLALRHDLLDHPTHRSSHTVPTPRGGGLGIVLTIGLGAVVIGAVMPTLQVPLAVILVPTALIALLGLADDRLGLSARLRLVVQFFCALAVVAMTVAYLGLSLTGSRILWLLVLVVAVVWCTNLYNFMDGIDGIAGAQGVFVAACAAVLLSLTKAPSLAALLWVTAAACAGFLVWNWSPAKIFMGDVGSATLGFLFGALATFTSLSGQMSEWVWLLLLGSFAADATVTLAVRAYRREDLTHAHRNHTYQQLARRFGRHSTAVIVFMAINVVWLLPWAVFAASRPRVAMYSAFFALAPLIWAASRFGAGGTESGR